MTNVVVTGSQWGDEGKGKIVDWLSDRADVVVRYQGGHNAGHTLVIDGKIYKFSLLPSGLARGKFGIIGNGVVVDAWHFKKEVNQLRDQGLRITPEVLRIAENVPLILPLHRDLDAIRERSQNGFKIGTTKRGIGPAYEDKVGRRALRLIDLVETEYLPEKIDRLLIHHNALRRGIGHPDIEKQSVLDDLLKIRDFILPFMDKTWKFLGEQCQTGKTVLFEGAQGALLDVDHGTYPFVTSSNVVAGQASQGTGVSPKMIDYVLGITKAYTTRVGEGPFPTELDNKTGERIGEAGGEFGTVTGRKRRVGWFDAVIVKQMIAVSGIDGIALTKLDVLDQFEEINVCVAYEMDGGKIDYFPVSTEQQRRIRPIYESLPGWMKRTDGVRIFQDLPRQALDYVRFLEQCIGSRVDILSTSPDRKDTILIRDPFQIVG